jgi:trk system potassium uptake protein TrkA
MARKNTKAEFAVIGLGRFGSSLALKLVERGYTVLGIDNDRALVQRMADELTRIVALDSTDEDALRAVDIAAFDTVIVAIGAAFEANLMTTLALKSLGVRRIVCKAGTQRHRNVLLSVGAHQVVLPEQESAHRLAQALTTPLLIDQIGLGSNYTIGEFTVSDSLVGRTLRDCALRERFGVTLLAVQRDEQVIGSPPADFLFAEGDKLAVLGSNEQIDRMSSMV